ncbi:hypothetical protein ACGFYP_07440 [Streptomyces sp. NPDC048370]|uniref:hypothetical protein n=1 Tax=Streptomyces sp. NPDC048370 TaxID=3365540 RepID=UPI00370FAEE0
MGVYSARICARCDKPITGPYETVTPFSVSGARPNAYYHPKDSPDCGKPPPSDCGRAPRPLT